MKNIFPEGLNQMQKIISSPAYQELQRQQKILNSLCVNSEFVKNISQAQKIFANSNVAQLQGVFANENFLNSALAVQKSSINLFEKIKTVEDYKNKTLAEIFAELSAKKNLNEFPPEVQEEFFTLEEVLKNFCKDYKDIFSIVLNYYITNNSNSDNEIVNLLSYLMLLYQTIGFLLKLVHFDNKFEGD